MRNSIWLLLVVLASSPKGAFEVGPISITPHPVINPSAGAFKTCRLELVSFRTANDGWVSDMCAELFRTRDGGHTWRRDHLAEKEMFGTPLPPANRPDPLDDRPAEIRPAHLTFMHWFDPNTGITGGYAGSEFFLTRDGGDSWLSVDVPSSQWVYALFARGDTIWTCGSEGSILRSDDRGRTWIARPSPFNSDDRCMSLEFDADHHGRASGMNGSRWTTPDDGATWGQEHSASSLPHFRSTTPGPGSITTRGAGTVELNDGFFLRFGDPGHPARRVPLLAPATGERTSLIFAERLGPIAYGFTAKDFFLADDGEAWAKVSALPVANPQRATFTNANAVILESPSVTFRSESRGESWQQSANPELDRNDVARARGEPLPVPGFSAPLACLNSAADAELEVGYAIQGCFGGSRSTLSLYVQQGKARIGSHEISRAEREAIVRELDEAVTRAEKPSGCTSTTRVEATVTWSCGSGPVLKHALQFSTHDCGSSDGVAASTSFFNSRDPGYARANGVYSAAREIAKRDARTGPTARP